MRIHSDFRALARELEQAGCTLHVGGKHIRVERGGALVGMLPQSPSDHRAALNARALFRRRGVIQ